MGLGWIWMEAVLRDSPTLRRAATGSVWALSCLAKRPAPPETEGSGFFLIKQAVPGRVGFARRAVPGLSGWSALLDESQCRCQPQGVVERMAAWSRRGRS